MDDIPRYWVKLFGEKNAKVHVSKDVVSKLAGLNPNVLDDRVKFARYLGIQKSGMERLSEMTSSGQIAMVSDDDEDAEDDEGRPLPKNKLKWCDAHPDLQVLGAENLRNIYLRWSSGDSTLLSFKLITNKRLLYMDLNCLLSHVNTR